MTLRICPVMVVLALVGGGCAGYVKVDEPDKVLVDHIVQASTAGQAELNQLASLVSMANSGAAALVTGINQKLEDIKLNAKQVKSKIGPPENPTAYTPAASELARKESGASTGFWVGVGGFFLGLGGIALAVLKQTALGQAIQAVETLAGAGVNVKSKAAAGTLSPVDVKETYAAAVALAPPKVKAKIEAALTKVKSKIPVVGTTAAG